jgi:hypothetical protein
MGAQLLGICFESLVERRMQHLENSGENSGDRKMYEKQSRKHLSTTFLASFRLIDLLELSRIFD